MDQWLARSVLNQKAEARLMIGIRQKLILGFGGLLAIVAVIGLLTMSQINDLGRPSMSFFGKTTAAWLPVRI